MTGPLLIVSTHVLPAEGYGGTPACNTDLALAIAEAGWNVRLLASEEGLEWEPVISFRKDPYPMTGFGFGSISLPSGEFSSESFWISGEGVRGLDGQAQICGLNRKG